MIVWRKLSSSSSNTSSINVVGECDNGGDCVVVVEGDFDGA